MTQRVLIVDDEPDIRELLALTLKRIGLDCAEAQSLDQGIQRLKQETFDLCLTDMRLPDGDGLQLVQWVQQQQPHLPVAVITAHGNMELAIESLKAGAFDFVSKPIDMKRLKDLVNQALKINRPQQPEPVLLGESVIMQQLQQQIIKVSRSQAPVFIQGESGTGKELVARQIHALGPRADGPFVAVNCGAIPAELMESEFFGHQKGAFTGANADKSGFFQAAQGGTLFLDEVADLPLGMQVKLLRAIQEKKVRAIGHQQEISVDVRILSATHKPLEKMVDQGDFRQDLFYRINVINLTVPALRERGQDIKLLCQQILKRIAINYQALEARLDLGALAALEAYDFPGNVRELENILERAYALCDGNRIGLRDLQLQNHHEQLSTALNAKSDTHPEPRPGHLSLDEYLMDIEREAVEQALERTHWNRTAAAKDLGLSFRTLRYRLKKLGLE